MSLKDRGVIEEILQSQRDMVEMLESAWPDGPGNGFKRFLSLSEEPMNIMARSLRNSNSKKHNLPKPKPTETQLNYRRKRNVALKRRKSKVVRPTLDVEAERVQRERE